MVMHPVGPLPASTYWRRRLVLGVTALVLLLVAKSCAGGGSTPSPTPTPKPKPTATATARPSVTATPGPRPTGQAAAGCTDSALTLTTTTDAETYAPGATPRFTLEVKNTGAQACRRDLGAGAVELLVFSGTDRVWSSDDCNPSTAKAPTSLPPGGAQSIVKTWPGTRSLPGCAGSKATAKLGTYRVVARVGTLKVDGAVFRLRG